MNGERGGAGQTLVRLEALVTAFERGLIVVLLAIMSGAVFLDALHRIFAARSGRTERLVAAVLPASAGALAQTLAPTLLAFASFGVVYAALRTRQQGAGSRKRSLVIAATITVALVAGTRLLVLGLPNGLVWSQQMALCFMLWLGLTGGSLATREHGHVVFELASKLWPTKLKTPVEWLSRLFAAGFSLFLAYLSVVHAHEHYVEWATSDGLAGLFEAFRVPKWFVYGFFPIPLTIMGLRFLAFGVRAPEEGITT